MSRKYTFMGVGSPLVDILSHIEDDFLHHHIEGDKGGMEMVNHDDLNIIMNKLSGHKSVAGGSAANTITGTAMLGFETCFLGKIGNDHIGNLYKEHASKAGICDSRFKYTDQPTGRCLSLVTPDSERTMRTFLGASSLLHQDEITVDDFAEVEHAHIEGYVLFNRDLALHILKAAKEAGSKVSLDLASFEVVKANHDIIMDLLNDYVDIVFANEDEAEAICGSDDPILALDQLAEVCTTSAVKLGAEGAWIKQDGERHRIDSHKVNAIDTTGAGDLWAAGFLSGYYKGKDIPTCGYYGSVLGAEVVQILGASISDERWQDIKERLA